MSFELYSFSVDYANLLSRGKKVYRRFDDAEDEEEEIDPDDLGLLEHTADGSDVKPLKTLTRKSVKPTRLFQTEEQQKAREVEKEEEALTDIEDAEAGEGDESAEAGQSNTKDADLKSGRSLRSTTQAAHVTSNATRKEAMDSKSSKNGSPFDSWPRVKTGSRSAGPTPKGRKRGATEAVMDDHVEV